MHAVQAGNPRAVSLLLEAGANIESEDSSGYTPLLHAAKMSHLSIEVVKQLLDKGAKIDQAENDGCTPLFIACQG